MTSMIAAQLIAPYLLGPQQPITGITQLEAYALPSSRACLPCKEAHIDSLPIDMHHLAWAVGGAVTHSWSPRAAKSMAGWGFSP